MAAESNLPFYVKMTLIGCAIGGAARLGSLLIPVPPPATCKDLVLFERDGGAVECPSTEHRLVTHSDHIECLCVHEGAGK